MTSIISARELLWRVHTQIYVFEKFCQKAKGLRMNTKNTYVNDFPDSRSSVADSHRSAMLGTVDADDQYVVIARRFGVLAVMLIFIACYLYGIAIYGVVLGVGLGWLPSGLIAWLAVLSIGFGINRMRRNQ